MGKNGMTFKEKGFPSSYYWCFFQVQPWRDPMEQFSLELMYHWRGVCR